eukprot:scaffold5865_cov186-Amphora_coffeaeformis.AAC.2
MDGTKWSSRSLIDGYHSSFGVGYTLTLAMRTLSTQKSRCRRIQLLGGVPNRLKSGAIYYAKYEHDPCILENRKSIHHQTFAIFMDMKLWLYQIIFVANLIS